MKDILLWIWNVDPFLSPFMTCECHLAPVAIGNRHQKQGCIGVRFYTKISWYLFFLTLFCQHFSYIKAISYQNHVSRLHFREVARLWHLNGLYFPIWNRENRHYLWLKLTTVCLEANCSTDSVAGKLVWPNPKDDKFWCKKVMTGLDLVVFTAYQTV